MSKLRFAAVLAALSGLALAGHAAAQAYPVKPVRMIVGFASGGGTDIMARILSRKLAESWPHALIVENRPGADGSIATEIVAKSAPDGYTLVMVSNAHTITPFQRKLGYDAVKDFAPVTLTSSTPNLLLVHPSLPVKTVKDLVALAKARPGQLTYGSSGAGTTPFLAMELFKSMTGTQIVHVPYKGSSPAMNDLVGGHIQLMFGAVSTTLPQVKSRRLRAIAVSSPQRWPAVPDVPTVAESGLPGFETATWYGVLAPAGIPAAVMSRLSGDMIGALRSPEISAQIEQMGFQPVANKPDEFAEVIRRDMQKWGTLLKSLPAAAAP